MGLNLFSFFSLLANWVQGLTGFFRPPKFRQVIQTGSFVLGWSYLFSYYCFYTFYPNYFQWNSDGGKIVFIHPNRLFSSNRFLEFLSKWNRAWTQSINPSWLKGKSGVITVNLGFYLSCVLEGTLLSQTNN